MTMTMIRERFVWVKSEKVKVYRKICIHGQPHPQKRKCGNSDSSDSGQVHADEKK
jgi:hypothetical protein